MPQGGDHPVNALNTLKKNRDFSYVYRRGRSVSSPMMSLIYLKRGEDNTRAGFSVGKKTGKSVTRNRIKRRLREAYRMTRSNIKDGFDLIFVAREPLARSDFAGIQDTMRTLLARAKLLEREAEIR
jgi:ribonuclease P protein component